MNKVTVIVLCAIFAIGAFAAGLITAIQIQDQTLATTGTAAETAVRPPVCGTDAASVASRNIVWNMLNNVAPEKSGLEATTGIIIIGLFSPESNATSRSMAIKLFTGKAGLLYPSKELGLKQLQLISDGTPQERYAAVKNFVAQDRRAGDFAYCILSDTARLEEFINGRPVPLETVPTAASE